jgi:hypothetical protein
MDFYFKIILLERGRERERAIRNQKEEQYKWDYYT